jgi:hypothetical protein
MDPRSGFVGPGTDPNVGRADGRIQVELRHNIDGWWFLLVNREDSDWQSERGSGFSTAGPTHLLSASSPGRHSADTNESARSASTSVITEDLIGGALPFAAKYFQYFGSFSGQFVLFLRHCSRRGGTVPGLRGSRVSGLCGCGGGRSPAEGCSLRLSPRSVPDQGLGTAGFLMILYRPLPSPARES